MAAVGASGLSLVLGVYNTQQIATLKETIASISGSGTAKNSGKSSVLTTTVVPPPQVVQPAQVTIQQPAFQAASSSEIKELQERVEELESFSNSVSTSSTSNSSNMSQSVGGLATTMSDLEIFANATDVRSSTNETNILMANDEIDRLTTFATDGLVSVRDRLAVAEESVSTNLSNITLLETSVGDVATGVSDANTRIDAAIVLTTGLTTSLATTQAAVEQSSSSITQNSTSLTGLVQDMDKLGDDIGLVNGNEIETRANLASLGASWNELNANAYVADGWLNAVKLRATNCKLGLTAHNGQTSALHFASLNDPNWSIYVSSATGKAPDGTTPKTHGDVTRNAVRMRLDSSSTSGFILEKSDGVGVFSVNAQGNAVMENASMQKCHVGEGSIGKLGSGAAFAYKTHLSDQNYAMMQYPSGNTYLNCKPSKTVYLANGTSNKATVTATGFHAKSQSGSNYQVGDELESLRSRVADIENSYVDRRKTIRLYNQSAKKYLRFYSKSQVRIDVDSSDVRNHFTINHD